MQSFLLIYSKKCYRTNTLQYKISIALANNEQYVNIS